MSDIKIPFDPGWSAGVTITPELARQIVALARDEDEEQQFPPEARIAPAKLILNPSGTMHTAQPLDMTRQIGPGIVDARHAAAEPFLGEAHQSELEKAHEIAAEDRSCGLTPVDAGGEDAAVKAITEVYWEAQGGVDDAMRAILAAIRAGKVPGVFYGIDTGKISALRASVRESISWRL